MSKNRFKVEYECDCGIDYGSCGRKSVYLFEYNCSIDIGSLVHIHHINEKDCYVESLGSLTDNQQNALIKVLTTNEVGKWTDDEVLKFKEARGF